jgi:oxygen-independent coproporphyrinogen-3 oxidase
VIAMRPSRVALFGYAHVPWMKPHQRLIDADDLPDAVQRFRQAELAARLLEEGGYVRVGLDHFALPDDPLAVAAANGTLRRNFQGYTDDPADAVVGLGASSIGSLPGAIVQNERATGSYMRLVAQGRLPVVKGVALSVEDRVRGHAIERLMCDFALDLDRLAARFPDAPGAVAAVRADADDLLRAERGLVERDGAVLRVAAEARPFVRQLAASFDAYLRSGHARYSIAV